MKGFKEFILRGNLIELAVAFIMGAAFTKVVESFTQMLMDIIGKVGGNPDFSSVTIGGINVGVFLTAVVSFLMISLVVYFGLVLPYNKAKAAFTRQQDEDAAESSEVLLAEIRDLLKQRA